MELTQGLLLIAALAFAISMLVSSLIFLLGLFNSTSNDSSSGVSLSIFKRIGNEIDQFNRIQKTYRLYWRNKNVPTNELIIFYHEQ